MHLLLTLETPYKLASRINESPYLIKTKEKPQIKPDVPVGKLLKLADMGIKPYQEERFSVRGLHEELSRLV